jgi:hypothetical protein
MLMYEKYIGKNRDDFKSYEDLIENYKVTYNADLNWA